MTFARVLRCSGLTKIELGLIYGVSRQTIHTWANGSGARPGTILARQAATITQALGLMMDKKILPFGSMDAGQRRRRIETMAKGLQELKPVPAQ